MIDDDEKVKSVICKIMIKDLGETTALKKPISIVIKS